MLLKKKKKADSKPFKSVHTETGSFKNIQIVRSYPRILNNEIKQITNKDLLYSTGNSAQYLEIIKWENNLKKNRHMYMHN